MRTIHKHDQIWKNEAILHMEQLWQRELTDHEKNLLGEVYDFARRVELEQWYSNEIIEWQQGLVKHT
ncbi:hypothetical protein [Bacillus sp. T33-2]|uniref:hypothetical protein n=1 Tax=Bacillus sp. T33-2 TaxID=2054168 RepID=UPI000C763F01|nr:hypothetical protein [Bacillus sp. T33-2]PLR99488.1 hypothetical protein CVD19_00055 [Bacillus sp. T33-2]